MGLLDKIIKNTLLVRELKHKLELNKSYFVEKLYTS